MQNARATPRRRPAGEEKLPRTPSAATTAPADNSDGATDDGYESPAPEESPPRPAPRRDKRTYLGRMVNEMYQGIPFDKVLGSIIISLMIYVGAARLSEFSSDLTKMKLDIQGQRADTLERQKADIVRIELALNSLEDRVAKHLKQEIKHSLSRFEDQIKNILSRLDDMGQNVHELDKRQALSEVRMQLQQTYIPAQQQRYLPDAHHQQEALSQALQTQLETMVRVTFNDHLRRQQATLPSGSPAASAVGVDTPAASGTGGSGSGAANVRSASVSAAKAANAEAAAEAAAEPVSPGPSPVVVALNSSGLE